MARTEPVNTGYTILNGAGTGPNGHRIDVWVEYLLGQQDIPGNLTPVTAYFYAALNPNYSATTAYNSGLNSHFTVDGVKGVGVSGGGYDFTSAAKVNLLGSFTGNIPHDPEGKKELTFAGSFTTRSSYITGGNISQTVSLPPIVQVPELTAQDTTLAEKCHVSWTPTAPDHSYTLEFSLGQWSVTTEKISPNALAKVTYTDTVLPLEIARQFPEKTGTMSVTLTAYKEAVVLGNRSTTFTVTVPENDQTRPVVTAELKPECGAFPDLYVQRLGKVQAEVEATDPLGAEITAVYLSVGTASWEDRISGFLEQSGTLPVKVTAVSSRGFSGIWQTQIHVYAYDSPRLIRAEACRCLSDGTADPGGTFLSLQAEHTFNSLQGANTATLQWRYKPENGSFGPWQAIEPVAAGVVLEKHLAYTVQFRTLDSAGGTDVRTIAIAEERVYMHRTRNAMGLGGYAEGSDVLDLYWNLQARKGINGAYIRTAEDSFTLRLADPDKQQAAFVMGFGVCGVVSFLEGTATWEGSQGITVTANGSDIQVTLPEGHGNVLIISPDLLEI